MGQMVRGGRSWPSAKKLGGAAKRCGNTAETGCGSAEVMEQLTMPVTEQDDAQRLHLSDVPAWSWVEASGWSWATSLWS